MSVKMLILFTTIAIVALAFIKITLHIYLHSLNKIKCTNLNSSAGASEALLLYIDDILRSLTGRSCQSASSGSARRRLDAPASSPRIPVARFVPRNDILFSLFTTYIVHVPFTALHLERGSNIV